MIEIYIFKVESFSETKVWCVAWEHEMNIDQEKKSRERGVWQLGKTAVGRNDERAVWDVWTVAVRDQDDLCQ